MNLQDYIVLSLCDYSTNSVKFWARFGFECWCVDTQHPKGIGKLDCNIRLVGADIREFVPPNDKQVYFMSSFPPCTHLAISGARWFKGKGLKLLSESIELVARCAELSDSLTSIYYIENPIGTLATYWRKPDFVFNPYEYAGYSDKPLFDSYTKKTCLWVGECFKMPKPKPCKPVLGSKMHRISWGNSETSNARSETPIGFAKAVFEANAPKSLIGSRNDN